MRQQISLENLESEAEVIQNFLDEDLPDGLTDPSSLMEYGNMVAVYVSRTGQMKSDAVFHYHTKKKQEIFETLKDLAYSAGVSTTTQNEIIKSLCAYELSIMEWCDRLNSAASKRLSWCQSELGLIKNDMMASKGINNRQY